MSIVDKDHCACGKRWDEENPDCVFNYHKKPRDRDKFTWVTNTREKPDSEIDCQKCDAIIIFSSAEILRAKAIGTNTSTPCRHCAWHPTFPPEPWRKLDEDSIKYLGYVGQWD